MHQPPNQRRNSSSQGHTLTFCQNHMHTSVHLFPRDSGTMMKSGNATSTQVRSFCLLSHVSWARHQETDPGGECADPPSHSPHAPPPAAPRTKKRACDMLPGASQFPRSSGKRTLTFGALEALCSRKSTTSRWQTYRTAEGPKSCKNQALLIPNLRILSAKPLPPYAAIATESIR